MKERKHVKRINSDHLKKTQALSTSKLSNTYFMTADDLLSIGSKEINEQHNKYKKEWEELKVLEDHKYFHSCIILYCTGFEAFMNEYLLFHKAYYNKKNEYKEHIDTLNETINNNVYDKGMNVKQKITNFFTLTVNKEKEVDEIIDHLHALYDLRHELIHFKGEFLDNSECPENTLKAYNLVKKDFKSNKINIEDYRIFQCISWTDFFNTKTSVIWARKAIANALLFLDKKRDLTIGLSYAKFLGIDENERVILINNRSKK